MVKQTIAKILSPNDVGETGGHQAGLLIPKKKSILSFFPSLAPSIQNPRVHLLFEDQSGYHWEFAFIYYNNRFFGGTRNEYRLTRMTRYIREARLVSDDEVLMHRHANGSFSISYRRDREPAITHNEACGTVLILSPNWKVINI